MIVVHLDDDIVFGTLLPPPALRLLMFVSNKKMRDVNRLKDGKLMIGWPELQKRADRADQSVLIFSGLVLIFEQCMRTTVSLLVAPVLVAPLLVAPLLVAPLLVAPVLLQY